jgi:hypothetical protein
MTDSQSGHGLAHSGNEEFHSLQAEWLKASDADANSGAFHQVTAPKLVAMLESVLFFSDRVDISGFSKPPHFSFHLCFAALKLV